MDGLLEELAGALRERIAVIGDRELREKDPEKQMERLKEVSERIVDIHRRLPKETDGELMHYLERCSYEKALARLTPRGEG